MMILKLNGFWYWNGKGTDGSVGAGARVHESVRVQFIGHNHALVMAFNKCIRWLFCIQFTGGICQPFGWVIRSQSFSPYTNTINAEALCLYRIHWWEQLILQMHCMNCDSVQCIQWDQWDFDHGFCDSVRFLKCVLHLLWNVSILTASIMRYSTVQVRCGLVCFG